MKKNILTTLFLLFLSKINAQTEGGDFMRNIGQIYVVVGVIFIIFIGIIAFLISLDRKISKLEKQNKE